MTCIIKVIFIAISHLSLIPQSIDKATKAVILTSVLVVIRGNPANVLRPVGETLKINVPLCFCI